MHPKVLVLDEPTAGLDPKGRDDILDQIAYLHKQSDMTVILVSHSMEDIARYADRIVVMNKGAVMYNGTPKEVFAHYQELEKIGLAAPQVTYIMHDLKEKGFTSKGKCDDCERSKQMRLCGHWRRRYDKRYNNRTILSGKECVTQIGSKSKAGGNAALPDLTVLFNSIPGYVMTTLFLILVIRISKVPFSFIVRGLKPVIMLLMITVLFNLFLTRDGAVLFMHGFSRLQKRSQDSGIYGNPADLSDHRFVTYDIYNDPE